MKLNPVRNFISTNYYQNEQSSLTYINIKNKTSKYIPITSNNGSKEINAFPNPKKFISDQANNNDQHRCSIKSNNNNYNNGNQSLLTKQSYTARKTTGSKEETQYTMRCHPYQMNNKLDHDSSKLNEPTIVKRGGKFWIIYYPPPTPPATLKFVMEQFAILRILKIIDYQSPKEHAERYWETSLFIRRQTNKFRIPQKYLDEECMYDSQLVRGKKHLNITEIIQNEHICWNCHDLAPLDLRIGLLGEFAMNSKKIWYPNFYHDWLKCLNAQLSMNDMEEIFVTKISWDKNVWNKLLTAWDNDDFHESNQCIAAVKLPLNQQHHVIIVGTLEYAQNLEEVHHSIVYIKGKECMIGDINAKWAYTTIQFENIMTTLNAGNSITTNRYDSNSYSDPFPKGRCSPWTFETTLDLKKFIITHGKYPSFDEFKEIGQNVIVKLNIINAIKNM